MAIQYIQPGKPNQNAYVERFNRTLRDELLDQHLFARLEDVREAVYWWMLEYNEDRPHTSLDDLSPIEYAQTVLGGGSALHSSSYGDAALPHRRTRGTRHRLL